MRPALHALVALLVVSSAVAAVAVADPVRSDAAGATAPQATEQSGINVDRTHPSTDLGSFDAVVNASRADLMIRSDVAVPGDALVVRLDRGGVGAAIANASGDNATARFRSWLARNDTRLTFAPTGGDGPALDADGPGVAVRDGTLDGERRTYLVVRTGAATFGDGAPTTDLEGREYRFTVRDGNGSFQSDAVEFVAPTAELREPGTRDGDLLLTRPRGEVSVRTSLPPNTPLSVTLAVPDGDASTTSATVTEPTGTNVPNDFTDAHVAFNLVDAAADQRLSVAFGNSSYPYTATLYARNTTVDAVTPMFGAVPGTASGTSFRMTNITAPEGGHVVVHEGSVDGEVTGSLAVKPGTRGIAPLYVGNDVANGTTLYVVLHRDANGNGIYDPGTDEPYTRDGETVVRELTYIRPEGLATPSPTPTASPTPTEPPTDPPTTTASGTEPDPTTPGSDGDGAGFGPVAVVAAAAALALLARWY